MKLEQLREMLAIVEHGSLRAAARRLGIPQPALTRTVHALESELGVALFERETRGMTLTARGRLFHRRATAMVNELQKARDELSQSAGLDEGTVVVALSIMPHLAMLPRALPYFRKRYPKVRLHVIEGLFPDVEGRVRSGTIDFYVGAAPRDPPAPGLVTRILVENTRAVVGRKGHPLSTTAGRPRSLRELAGTPWAVTALDYDAESDFRHLFAAHGLPDPVIALRVHSAMSLMVALASTDHLAMLPVQWKEFPLTRDALQIIPVKERLPAPAIILTRRPDLPLTPAAEFFCDALLRYLPAQPR
ncbi:LysR substrate-binding domain-containing protein [Pendulispora rubella]|uniref:LysR substrate-binding domain-containing protein n=1 Tax=Pendulispora rubella TaxID=2741070 RepID=A0ABZ2LEM1_9BACT